MYRTSIFIVIGFILFFAPPAVAQYVLKGIVTDQKGAALPGASVALDGTLDGTTTDSSGRFQLPTSESGLQTLSITAIAHEPYNKQIDIAAAAKNPIEVRLHSINNTLEQVSITAGSFGSADGSQKTVLEPLDIVTTAGSGADPIAAMQMLPGVQRNGTQTGMMVRGGDASEAAIVVDGLTLQNPFFSDAPGVQQRSRFGAFQFKGIAFSSGGYSARYGQAMSSVLEMNTLDLPDESTINLGLHMAGIYAQGTKLFNDNSMSLSVAANYTNLSPFYGIAKTNFDFYDVPKGGGGSLNYIWKTKSDGLLKVMANYTGNKSGMSLPDPFQAGQFMRFGLRNDNAYAQATYKQSLSEKVRWFSASSYSYNNDDTKWGALNTLSREQRGQVRSELTWFALSKLSFIGGGEWQHFHLQRRFDTFPGAFIENQLAAYLEAEWTPLHWLALKPGLRYEHSNLLATNTLAPRFAASVKTGQFSTISVASGLFYQNPDKQYLMQGYRPEQQQAAHYIANFNYMHNDRSLRLEAYQKSYSQLVRELISGYDPNSYRFIYGPVDNSGTGWARGLELFWRDKKSVNNLDYWLSYSYINSKRLYRNFPSEATPDFISDHNFSLVTKYWLEKVNCMVSGTFSFASGKPYYDPANAKFLSDRTPNYRNVALQVSHLRSFGKWFAVFYVSVDNVLNTRNIFGYRYSADGKERFAMEPALFRTVFAGINISLSKFDKDEL